MIEGFGLIVRGLYEAAALVGFGTLLCLYLAARQDRFALASWRRRWVRVALVLLAAALLLGLGVLALQVASVQSEAPWRPVAQRLLLESRFGMVWMTREALLLAACVLLTVALIVANREMPTLALLSAGAALAISPLSGHSAAAEPAWPALAVHAVHVIAVGSWWGALPALAALVLGSAAGVAPAAAGRTFRQFSVLALWLMLLIIASGTWLALTHVERWPALLATSYGRLLMLKISLLVIVLVMAATLRWRLLPALLTADTSSIARRSAHWIMAECLLAAAIVLTASQLAQTVPARHDEIYWWLPFRLSIDATWDSRWTPARAWSGLALAVCAAVLASLGLFGRVQRKRALLGALVLGSSAAALALPALSVDAYPDTYRKASVPYQTVSVAAGADLFTVHCTRCHGSSGHGDGKQANTLPLRPADLTEPHTALHTAGDIFWWLTHGKPPGVMPAFADRLSEDDRWDLINFLRTLSAGYQARILTDRIVPGRPWLSAVDFNLSATQSTAATLKDYRRTSAVLLVFFSWPQSSARLRQLAQHYAGLRSAGVEVLAVSTSQLPRDVRTPFPVIVEGDAETVRTYALLRRTLADADAQDKAPMPEHMEILVDRYGYIRARWLPSESEGWSRPDTLFAQLALLGREGQIRPPPEDHVH